MHTNEVPAWVGNFLTTDVFKNAVKKATESESIWGLPHTKREAEGAKAEATGVKAEATGVSLAGNLVKVEGNVFALQADVLRIDMVFKDIVLNRLETSRAVRELRDSYPKESRKQIKELVDPVRIRKDLDGMKTRVTRSLDDAKRRAAIGERRSQTVHQTLSRNLRSAFRRITVLEKKGNTGGGRSTGQRVSDLEHSARTLATRERQLRAATLQLTRAIDAAHPNMRRFGKALLDIRRELTS